MYIYPPKPMEMNQKYYYQSTKFIQFTNLTMASWSAENATNAYLKTLRMGQNTKEPDVAEFISALAAGNNAQLMVVACANAANSSTTLALVAAAHQTGGRVICILPQQKQPQSSKHALGFDAICHVDFVIGEAKNLLKTRYSEADFVVVDCNLEKYEDILEAVQETRKGKRTNGSVVVGYNAFSKGSWRSSTGSKTQLLPIGGGLLVTRIAANYAKISNNNISGKKSHWVVKVDKCTGEEHVFRVRFPQGKQIEA